MLKIKDLKKGEIYYGSWENGDKRCIFKQGVAAINSLDQFDNYSKEWCTSSIVTLRESTLGEKHWLNECIKANEFISYEEAMKTFKPQYIVNKWYKVKDWKFSYYVKFKSLEKVGYNKINGEIINAGTYKGDDYLANDQMEEKLELLEDLSEIQQWLPEGHVDKVSTFKTENKPIIKESKPIEENNNSEFKVGDWVIWKGSGKKTYKISKINSTLFWIFYNGQQLEYQRYSLNSEGLRKAKLEEIPTDNLTNEELLDIAREYFKVGTRFICSNTTQEAVISTANFKINGNCYINEYDDKQNFMLTNDYYHCIYSNKAFAKIISSPNKTKEITPNVKVSNFVLPDKWVVCPETEDNLILIKQYFNKFNDYGISHIENAYTSDGKYQTFVEDALKKGYTQITFNEFKNYVFQRQNTTTQQTKKDDVLSPKVENKLLNIVKVRKSVPTKTDKKRIKLTIIKPKQLKLN